MRTVDPATRSRPRPTAPSGRPAGGAAQHGQSVRVPHDRDRRRGAVRLRHPVGVGGRAVPHPAADVPQRRARIRDRWRQRADRHQPRSRPAAPRRRRLRARARRRRGHLRAAPVRRRAHRARGAVARRSVRRRDHPDRRPTGRGDMRRVHGRRRVRHPARDRGGRPDGARGSPSAACRWGRPPCSASSSASIGRASARRSSSSAWRCTPASRSRCSASPCCSPGPRSACSPGSPTPARAPS